MIRFVLALSIFTVVLAGCSADSLTGPAQDRGLEPTASCAGDNTQPC